MDINIKDELKTLIQESKGPCVSIYMPTHRAGMETQQDPIRLKNLLGQAEEQLISLGVRRAEAVDLLSPARGLLDNGFQWRHQDNGLALFISPETFRSYHIPISIEELVIAADRFHLKPLLPILSGEVSFYVLALSQNDVKLFKCTRYAIAEVKMEGVPKSLDEALKFDERERQVQYRKASPGVPRAGALVFDPKKDIWRFFLQVNDGVHGLLKEENTPLILAGVEYLLPIYREVNTYGQLLEGGITGNAEGLKPQELHEEAWALIEPYFLKYHKDAAAKYIELVGTGRASGEIREAVPAAYFGRVDSLFLARGVRQWGSFDPDSNSLTLHQNPEPGDEDLLDLAAAYTFLNRGNVYVVEPEEVPGGSTLAAIFRY